MWIVCLVWSVKKPLGWRNAPARPAGLTVTVSPTRTSGQHQQDTWGHKAACWASLCANSNHWRSKGKSKEGGGGGFPKKFWDRKSWDQKSALRTISFWKDSIIFKTETQPLQVKAKVFLQTAASFGKCHNEIFQFSVLLRQLFKLNHSLKLPKIDKTEQRCKSAPKELRGKKELTMTPFYFGTPFFKNKPCVKKSLSVTL